MAHGAIDMREEAAGCRLRGDEELVARCLAGDRSAWDEVVRAYWKRVFNVAYKFVGRHDDAQDLAQEVFVKVFRSLDTYDRRASFDSWLLAVSRNLCIDHYRRQRREQDRMTAEVDPDGLVSPDVTARPDARYERLDEVEFVRQAIARLTPTLREAVTLRDVHDLSYDEIAARLHVPAGTVKSRINRGRAELAEYLRALRHGVVGGAGHANDQDHQRR